MVAKPNTESVDRTEPLQENPTPVQSPAQNILPAQPPGAPNPNDTNVETTSLPSTVAAAPPDQEASRAGGADARINDVIQQQPVQYQAPVVHTPSAAPSHIRPPVLLDSAIVVLLVLVIALLFRKIS